MNSIRLFHRLRRLRETGIMRRFLGIYDHSQPTCSTQKTANVPAVGLESFSPAFFLLFIGMGIAVVQLLMEMFWHYKKELTA